MLYLIVSADPSNRIQKRNEILKKNKGTVITLDDSLTDLFELRAYLFPSLFSFEAPIIHGKFLIEKNKELLTTALLKELIASPSIFLLEESELPTTLVSLFEKEKAFVFHEKKISKKGDSNNIFGVTVALTGKTKKDRWIAFRKALENHSAEALVGILYWKLRSLIENAPKDEQLKKTYTRFIKAHKEAWQKGIPLEVALEKIILEN